jgi:DNA-binding CsgD family transcriptional regulator
MTHSKTKPIPVPPDLQALESEDGEVMVLSFSLRKGPVASLSPAESAVAAHLLDGRTNAEIARLRGTSERTVANQVASLYRKLGVKSRLELLVLAPLVREHTKIE